MGQDELVLSDHLRSQRVLITLLCLMNLIMFGFIILMVIRPLKIYIHNIQDDTTFDIVGAYEFKYLALTYNNIYEVNAVNKETLIYDSKHDKLTGALNRAAFDGIKQYLKKSRSPLALLIIDVDRFKTINDTYGHEIGDRVLKKTAALLQHNFSSKDYFIRYGGDEFVILMTDICKENQSVISDRISQINDILTHPQDQLPEISLSVGCAFSEKGYHDDLFRSADAALYTVKNSGRCGCSFAE